MFFFEFVELAPPLQATLCHFDQDCSNRTSVPADVGISALFDTRAGQIDKFQSHPRPLCSARSE